VGEPRVDLASLAYSPMPDQRAVVVRINGAAATRLREGESAGGVEVTLIMRDRVYLRHAGNIFAVYPGR
jgi:hypothetical protein